LANTDWYKVAVIDGNPPPTDVAVATAELPEPKKTQRVFMSDADQARVRNGEVIASIRLVPRPALTIGPLILDSGLGTTEVHVTGVVHTILSALSTLDLNCAGYDSMYEFRSHWSKYSKDLAFAKPVTVIYFRGPNER
jgi:hypothetical protein